MGKKLPYDPAHKRCKYDAFGQRFRAVRIFSGKTETQVAKHLGIDVANVLGYDRGFQRPTKENRRKMEDFFDGQSLITGDTPDTQVGTPPEPSISASLSGQGLDMSMRTIGNDVEVVVRIPAAVLRGFLLSLGAHVA